MSGPSVRRGSGTCAWPSSTSTKGAFVYYRLDTIRSATGADLRDSRALAELELAVLSRDFGVLVVPGE